MDALSNGGVAYVSSLLTVFTLYPYRDFVKGFDPSSFRQINYPEFCLSRYRGMMQNPSQPLLLASPHALLYFGYILGGGGVPGAIVGGLLHGNAKVCVGTVARRMGGGGEKYRGLGQKGYNSIWDCLVNSGKHFGAFSFFTGGVATAIISTIWYGGALIMLQRTYSGDGFFSNMFTAFSSHAFMTFLSAPLRNAFRSSLVSVERAGGVKTFQSYLAGEGAIFKEATSVVQSALRSGEVRFFFSGVFRTTFKTSVPFAFCYGVFKWAGGSIGYPGGNNPHRHMSRRMGRPHF